MSYKRKDPAMLSVAHRADVTMLPGRIDVSGYTPSVIDLQVQRIVAHYAVSISLALVIAELAFSSGRQA